MTQLVANYAKVLYELGIEPETVKEAKRRYLLTEELGRAFANPVITKQEKHKIIDSVFDKKLNHFLKVLCDYDSMSYLLPILDEFQKIYLEEHQILTASLFYVTEPGKSQLERINSYLANRFGYKKVQLNMMERPELVGGFILRVGDIEMDWSLSGRFKRLEQRLSMI